MYKRRVGPKVTVKRGGGGDVPEEIEETKCLDYNTHERPLEEHEQDATNEAHSPAELLFPREEVEGLLWSDDECDSGEEEQLRDASVYERKWRCA